MKYEVAETILKQMGGQGKLMAMLGVKNFYGDTDSVNFDFLSGKTHWGMDIQLCSDDTYLVVFNNFRVGHEIYTKRYEGIFADQLISLFETETGLRLSL